MDPDSVLPPADPPAVDFHPVVQAVYAGRCGSDAAAERFLAANGAFPRPTDLRNLAEAADRLLLAVERGERIAVFGHDDADGITSCAILVEALETLDADVDPYIPARAVEGHGLYPDLIRRFHVRGAKVLVTTDGCSTNVAEAELAQSLRMDVLVTDHHEIADGRATVDGLVNPKAEPDSRLTDLTGAGVAALLAREVLRRARPNDPAHGERVFRGLLDLVALGTVADWADLGSANREWVVQGLSRVARGDRPSLSIMRRALGIGPDGVFRVRKASRLANAFAAVASSDGASPGLNALLGRATWAGDVDDLVKARLRQEHAEDEAVEIGWAAARAQGVPDGAPAVILLPGLASRLLGKVATDLVLRTDRPAAVLTESEGRISGELRSPEGGHLVEILGGLRELFSSWGGHRLAAGFSAESAQRDGILAGLEAAFSAAPAAPALRVAPDAEIRRRDINLLFSQSLRAAMPFGKGNAAPVFRVLDYRQGGTAQDPDERGHIGVRLFEMGFPEKSEPYDPLVTFQPRGGGGLAVRFVGWAR
jgi:single-stranded-DNA-specific exonuclease